MNENQASNSRRHFLKVLAASASLPVLLRCSGSNSNDAGPKSVGQIAAGNISDLAEGSLKGLGSSPACIGRDANGVYAMTLICTHEGCDMSRDGTVSSSGVYCACHGSRFDATGNVTQGPAHSDLQHFEVLIDASGELTVDTNSFVDASTRLAV